MLNKDEFLVKALNSLKNEKSPTKQQKETMLNFILTNKKDQVSVKIEKIQELIFLYPWRFAFTISVLQSIIFTILFGTQYTNIFLSFLER